jgi:hypothetical protein
MSATADLTGGNQTPQSDQTPPSNQTQTQDWTSGLNDDLRGYVTTKGFKDVGAVVESYRNFEKLKGVPQDRLLTIPEKEDAPEWENIFNRLGTPKDKTEYNFEMPEEAKNEEFENWAREVFHKNKLTKKQAESIMKDYGDFLKTGLTKADTEFQQKVSTEVNELKTEWGAANEKYLSQAKRAVTALGVNPEQIDALEQALGYKGVMKMFQSIGSKLGEDSYVSGDSKPNNFGVVSPSEAKSRINDLMQDKDFVAKYLSKDVKALQEMERLHKLAAGA